MEEIILVRALDIYQNFKLGFRPSQGVCWQLLALDPSSGLCAGPYPGEDQTGRGLLSRAPNARKARWWGRALWDSHGRYVREMRQSALWSESCAVHCVEFTYDSAHLVINPWITDIKHISNWPHIKKPI